MNKHRGNNIEHIDNIYIYSDTKEKVSNTKRECGNCGVERTEEGHDGCLGKLPGLMNACCGHGDLDEAYVQFLDGISIHGENARTIIDILKQKIKND